MENKKIKRCWLLRVGLLYSLGFIFLVVIFRHYNSGAPICSAPDIDTTDWERVNVDHVSFKLPKGFVATQDHAGIHGTIHKFQVGTCEITYYPGFYHFSPPDKENNYRTGTYSDYSRQECKTGEYAMRVVRYQATGVPQMRLGPDNKYHFDAVITYHVYADWTRTIDPYPPYNSKNHAAYIMAVSSDRAGQLQALSVVHTLEINSK